MFASPSNVSIGSPLFSRTSWSSVGEAQYHGMRQEIANLSANQILKSSTEDLCDYFVAKYAVEVPILIEERIVADQRETEIDVSNDPGRYWRSPGPHPCKEQRFPCQFLSLVIEIFSLSNQVILR